MKSVMIKFSIFLRNITIFMINQSTQCIIIDLFSFKINIQLFIQVMKINMWIDKVGIICNFDDLFLFFIVFILNIPNNLFKNIFHSNKSGSAPILINNYCEMNIFHLNSFIKSL